MSRQVTPGDVLIISFPVHVPRGREQEGSRPAVVVATPREPLRFSVIVVVPLTTKGGAWAEDNPTLYRPLPVGAGGLTQPSIALLDQVRAVDVRRVTAYLGTLGSEAFAPLRNGLLALFA